MKKNLFCLSLLLVLFGANALAYKRYVTKNLNLRYGPGVEYGIITTLPKGTPVTISEDCDCKWILIEYCGHIGYVSTKYLSDNPSQRRIKRDTRMPSYNISSISGNSVKYYTNVYGNRVQSPTYYSTYPAGATALCRDGTYSFSRSRRGTCSHHGGVARWF